MFFRNTPKMRIKNSIIGLALILVTPTLYGQDKVILNNGTRLNCEILYEKPHVVKVKFKDPELIEVFGKKDQIDQNRIRALEDNGSHRLMKMGRASLHYLNEQPAIRGKFYGSNNKSISIALFKSSNKDGDRTYNTRTVSIDKLERVRWVKGNVATGAGIGAALGVIPGVIGGRQLDDDFYTGKSTTAALTAITSASGALIGAAIGAATSKRVKIAHGGNRNIWVNERHKLPPWK